ncbi:hypothetical protein [Faecalibacterium prausnitzii]|uniref:hypothetical protein n=1 Tax=Faecalibacterium prausnitzii TaxID=853 RepID=UPI0012DC24BD|nr:hypothetical protein [Faecalibacterium prausnitzii]
MKKRLISLLVALCMAVTLLPVSALTAWAEGGDQLRIVDGYPVGSGGEGWSYDGTTLDLHPASSTEYDFLSIISGNGNVTKCKLTIGGNATIVRGNFDNTVINNGKISGGYFYSSSPLTNHGTIIDGLFVSAVSNESEGKIENGTFRSTVTNNGIIKGGIFSEQPAGGTVASGYTLNINFPENGSYEIIDAGISYFGNSGYVIPNSNHNTSISIYIFFRDSQAILFPIDVTFGDTHCLLEDWAPSARYYDNGSGYFSVTFTAPPATANTVTLSKLTRLVIDENGYPVGTEGGTQNYSGNGWRFEKSNKTLTLESGDYSFWEQSEVQCPVIIKDGVTTIGGMFSKKVTNYGTVEKAVINNIFENRNTVKNSYFFNSSSSIAVTNHGGTMLDCLFENAPEGIESHTITEVEDYFISAELDGIAYQAIQTKFYFTGTPKLRVNLVKNGNVKPVTSINQKLNYGGLIEDYPVGYIFTVENDNEDVVLNAAPVPGKDDPKPEPKPDPKPEPEAPTYTLTVKGGTFTYNGGEAMTSANVPVDAEVKVTLNQSAVPEGMVFDLWAMDEASLLGNPAVAYNEESFTIPAGSVAKGSTVTVEAQYRDATIESEPSILGTAAIIGVAGAGTAVIVWQGYRIGMELYEKYFQPTPEETAAEQPAPEAPAAAAS